MAARKFKFVSPGVFLKEVDQSQLPKLPGNIGPILIGRTRKGPALRPVKVNSYAEFVEIFGEPVPGNQGEDVWRDGNGLLAPAYTHYAAKAYFAGGNQSPVTVVRLLGITGDNAGSGAEAKAGWEATKAFGLFVYGRGSDNKIDDKDVHLAAIFYTTAASTTFTLANTKKSDDNTAVNATGVIGDVVLGINGGKEFDLRIVANNTTTSVTKTINFQKGTRNYIRDVLNTNPVMTNERIATANANLVEGEYWLGETFEETIPDDKLNGFVVELKDGTMDDFEIEASAGRTGWVISQDEGLQGNFDALEQDKLFRAIALSEGEEFSKNYIVAVEDIRFAGEGSTDPYGSFSLVVKRRYGTRLETVESFTGCNLNPNSQNYLARQVGDQFFQWSPTEKRNKVYGNYPNRSKYIRLEVDQKVDNGLLSPSKMPFGYLGPIVPVDSTGTMSNNKVAAMNSSFIGASEIKSANSNDTTAAVKLIWPVLPLAEDVSVRGTDYLGAAIYKKTGSSLSSELNDGLIDYIRKLPASYKSFQESGIVSGNTVKYSWAFTLDDLKLTGDNLTSAASANVQTAIHETGSRKKGDSYTAGTGTPQQLTNLGFNKFWMPLVGGCDGVNIREADPFNNNVIEGHGTTDQYAYASIDRAIELVRDPEFVEFNLAAMPGITSTSLTTKLIQTCESRADALAIIDLPDVYKPPADVACDSFQDRIGTTPTDAANSLKARGLNSSYGAAYYPWVKISDTENSRELWAPPSVVALGVMAYTEKRDEVWFAPAGFNRGGLNEGNAGLPVLQVSEQLLSKQRDTLYDANINPIASFVTEGLVVFGQKTLQSTPSALDRINVRRLLIFVKKEVSRIASRLLFDQNVPATWNRFLGQVNPFLQSVKTRLGLSDYKVILDNSTTTPDLVDRNIMYAKIFLKPARSIEFIAVDFVITNTGASFDD